MGEDRKSVMAQVHIGTEVRPSSRAGFHTSHGTRHMSMHNNEVPWSIFDDLRTWKTR